MYTDIMWVFIYIKNEKVIDHHSPFLHVFRLRGLRIMKTSWCHVDIAINSRVTIKCWSLGCMLQIPI